MTTASVSISLKVPLPKAQRKLPTGNLSSDLLLLKSISGYLAALAKALHLWVRRQASLRIAKFLVFLIVQNMQS